MSEYGEHRQSMAWAPCSGVRIEETSEVEHCTYRFAHATRYANRICGACFARMADSTDREWAAVVSDAKRFYRVRRARRKRTAERAARRGTGA